MMRSPRPYRYELPLSAASEQVLREFGPLFMGRWALAESAVLYCRRSQHPVGTEAELNGSRVQFSMEVNLRSPNLGFSEGQLSRQRFPQTLGCILHHELESFRRRFTGGSQVGHSGPRLTQVTVTLPAAALRELRIRAFENGRDLYSEVGARLSGSAQREATFLASMGDGARELPVEIPRDVYESLSDRASAVGARPVAIATRRMLTELAAAGVA